MHEVWLQIIAAVVTLGGTIFGTVRYISHLSNKRERALLDHTQKTEQLMLEYFEKKNGHVERIVKSTTESNKELATAVNNLSTEIKVLAAKTHK